MYRTFEGTPTQKGPLSLTLLLQRTDADAIFSVVRLPQNIVRVLSRFLECSIWKCLFWAIPFARSTCNAMRSFSKQKSDLESSKTHNVSRFHPTGFM